MHIYLVRHTHFFNPENIYPFHLDLYLSEEGREHAKRIGQWFAENKLQNLPIHTSPIIRCVQTAEIIASYIHAFVRIDQRLIETSCPNLQGKKIPLETPWIVEEDDESRESRSDILNRVLNAYKERVNEGKDCILVSHGDALTILYYYLNSKKLPKYLWGPENIENIINRGEIVNIELNGDKIHSISRIKV